MGLVAVKVHPLTGVFLFLKTGTRLLGRVGSRTTCRRFYTVLDSPTSGPDPSESFGDRLSPVVTPSQGFGPDESPSTRPFPVPLELFDGVEGRDPGPPT